MRTCAAFVGCYNEVLGTVCYVNAGHTPGLLRYNSDVSELPATGMPLGLFAASTYEAPTVAVPNGGALLLVSRGVVEATHKREEFGLQRVKQQFGETPLNSAQGVASAALQAVRLYAPSAATQNDLTSSGAGAFEQSRTYRLSAGFVTVCGTRRAAIRRLRMAMQHVGGDVGPELAKDVGEGVAP